MSRTKTHQAQLDALQERLSYTFKDQALLREALTHGSVLDGAKTRRSYDRLEFLGDRVLGFIVADRLLREHQQQEEGELAPLFNALVDRHACARAARAADLGAAIWLSTSEEASGGRGKDAILADVCESVIAALYLDGGLDAAKVFVTRFWGDAFDVVKSIPRDAKTVLQEWAAARRAGLSYVVTEQSGPEHAPHFVVEVRIEGYPIGRGEGGSKREAQRAAAAAFLAKEGGNV